jgi:hypothetical protein
MANNIETELDDLSEGGICVLNLSHSSRTPFTLKRYSTLANHPAALSAQVEA